MDTHHPITPKEGWHVLHLFYHIHRTRWAALTIQEQMIAKHNLNHLVQTIRAHPDTQLLTLSVIGTKADVGFMLTCPDLYTLDRFAKQLAISLGSEVLIPAFSWFSVTELSEYGTTEEEYINSLISEDNLAADSPEFEAKLAAFRTRIEKYNKYRLYPNLADLADWPVFCFYPMSKRRAVGQNWYALDFSTRKKLMAGHARVGRTYTGRVRQLITGSTGLDNQEWGVTLFAHTTSDIKAIVYEMRFDPVSAEYAEFGDFYIGLQLTVDQLLDGLYSEDRLK